MSCKFDMTGLLTGLCKRKAFKCFKGSAPGIEICSDSRVNLQADGQS